MINTGNSDGDFRVNREKMQEVELLVDSHLKQRGNRPNNRIITLITLRFKQRGYHLPGLLGDRQGHQAVSTYNIIYTDTL